MTKIPTPPPIIYNLFPRLVGPFKQWLPHLKRAAEMHFNWIFINPIQMSGFSGSMYSIKDYYQIDPRYLAKRSKFSPEEQFRLVINRAHKLRLRVMLDLVINHTAIDSVLVEQHPEWYKRDENGRIVNPKAMDGDRVVAVWGDLAEIDNLNSPDRENLWAYWEKLVAYFLELGIDGFRCDAAYQVPTELWERLIQSAKNKNPEVKFFAESLGCPFSEVLKLAQAGFDFIFNSSKYWNFRDPWALEQYEQNRLQGAPSISFPESHDTERLAAELQGNWAAVKMRYAFAATFSTGVMMPIGFEFGFRKKLHVVETTPEDWEEPTVDLRDFIARCNQLKLNFPVFGEESQTEKIDSGNPQVLCLKKTSHNGRLTGLILLNQDLHHHQPVLFENLPALLDRPREIQDVSPEYARDFVPEFFEYHLRPAQIIILIGKRENDYEN